MKAYDKILLNKLLDTYEQSILYLEQGKQNRGIHFLFKKQTIPSYFDDETNDYEVINHVCESLEEQGLISIKWHQKKVGYMIERISLRQESVENAYSYLKRTPKKEYAHTNLMILESYKDQHEVLDHFISYLQERMRSNQSVSQYFDLKDEKGLKILLTALEGILTNTQECYMRELSMRLFQDSKILEGLEGKVKTILLSFDSRNQWLQDKESILAEYNIFKNPSYVMLKGCGQFQMENSAINLKDLPHGVGINSKDLEIIKIVPEENIKAVITIENLTVFNRFEQAGALLIYLGGYHNTARRKLLLTIYKQYPHIPFYHWGDIDVGGIRIFNDLVYKTQIPFMPLYMEKPTLVKYEAYTKSLTTYDRKNLEKMLKQVEFKMFYEVINYMLEKNIKLEQEIISYEEMKKQK